MIAWLKNWILSKLVDSVDPTLAKPRDVYLNAVEPQPTALEGYVHDQRIIDAIGLDAPDEWVAPKGLSYAVESSKPLQCFCRLTYDDPPCEMFKTGVCPNDPRLWPHIIEEKE